MGITSNLTQVKVSVDSEIAAIFKNACVAANVSMASAISKFMADYSNTAAKHRIPSQGFSSRRQRRAAIRKIISQLEQISVSEEDYCERIPDNLRNSAVFDRAEEFISFLGTAIEALISIDSI